MPYDPARTALLVRQTDAMGAGATLAEVTLANQLSRADDQVTFLRRALTNLLDHSVVVTAPDEDPCFVDLQVRAEDYEAAYEALGKPKEES